MGKIKKGVLGGFRGKVGTVVGSFWKGRAYMRALPEVTAGVPSEKQLQVRRRFSTLAEMTASLHEAIYKGFEQRAEQRAITQGDVFISDNWETVSVSAGGLVTIDYSTMAVADGNLKNVTPGTVDWGDEEHLTVSVTFTSDITETALADDEVYAVLYSPDLKEGILSMASTRSTGTVSIICPASWNGLTCHLWMFVSGFREGGNRQSHSVYVGQHEIA